MTKRQQFTVCKRTKKIAGSISPTAFLLAKAITSGTYGVIHAIPPEPRLQQRYISTGEQFKALHERCRSV